jgi:Niemann-Pick C1 protein
VDKFLKSPRGARYNGDIVFNTPGTPASGIKSHRFQFNWRKIEETLEQVKAMKSSRGIVKSIPSPLGTNAFVYGDNFQQIEQYASIGKEAVTNITTSVAMIALIIVVLLANPLASIVTFISVLSTIIILIGLMNFQGSYIDSVTVIFLVISLGLAVDYSVHVAHGFLAAREENIKLRLEKTLIVRTPLLYLSCWTVGN